MPSPITKLPYPSLTDPPHISNTVRPLVTALDSYCIPRFATTTLRNVAIPSPSLGMMCYVESYDELYVYNGNWVSSAPRVVFKTVDQVVASSSSLRDDEELFMLVEPNSVYYGELALMYNGDAGDIKVQMTGPAFCTVRCGQFVGLETDSVSVSNHVKVDARTDFASAAIAFGALTTGNALGARLKVTVVTQATAGTLKLRWAQNASNATATTMLTGSSMELWKTK